MKDNWLSYEWYVCHVYGLPTVAASNPKKRRFGSVTSGQSIHLVEVFVTWFPGTYKGLEACMVDLEKFTRWFDKPTKMSIGTKSCVPKWVYRGMRSCG